MGTEESYAKNRKRILAYQKQYYKKNREKIILRTRIWQSENKERVCNYRRRYYLDNKKYFKYCNEKWYKKNKQKCKDYKKDWLEKNPNYAKKYKKEWRQNNCNYDKDLLDTKMQRWKKAFRLTYGDSPRCMICKKALFWESSGDKKLQVVFDHRHGKGKNIIMRPSKWYRGKRFTRKNWSIWKKEDFGILCHQCNISLPTACSARKRYILGLIRYCQY